MKPLCTWQLGEPLVLGSGTERKVDSGRHEEGSHAKGGINELVVFTGNKVNDGRIESRHAVDSKEGRTDAIYPLKPGRGRIDSDWMVDLSLRVCDPGVNGGQLSFRSDWEGDRWKRRGHRCRNALRWKRMERSVGECGNAGKKQERRRSGLNKVNEARS